LKTLTPSRHEIMLPSYIIVGEGVIKRVGEVISRFEVKGKALVLIGEKVEGIVSDHISISLRERSISFDSVVIKEASSEEIAKAIEVAKEENPKVILGVGGGSVIDVAKLTANEVNANFVSVPTAASHDGIASPVVSIKGSPSKFVKVPSAIVADIDVISKAPHRLIASGCGDIIAKLTAVRDWELAHKLKGEYYGDYAASLARMSALMIVRHAEAIAKGSGSGIRLLVEALISCGVAMCIAGSSRPCSGSEHLFSHALDLVAPKPALHGEQCGVGTIMMSYLHKMKWYFIRKVLKTVGAPTTAKELGVHDYYIVKALTIAHKIRDRYTILGESGLSEDAAERLAKATGVID